jgi:hypothetical protein
MLLAALMFGFAAEARAQAQLEQMPAPQREKGPPPPVPSLDNLVPGCRAVWVDFAVPVETLHPREVIVREPVTTLEVVYRPERRKVSEIVLEPREVTREVTVCITEPVTTTDPVTGKCCTIEQPVTKTKQVKETEFVAVPKEREIVVQVPELRPVAREVLRKHLLLEWKTEFVQQGCAARIPGGELVNTEDWLAAPKSCGHE